MTNKILFIIAIILGISAFLVFWRPSNQVPKQTSVSNTLTQTNDKVVSKAKDTISKVQINQQDLDRVKDNITSGKVIRQTNDYIKHNQVGSNYINGVLSSGSHKMSFHDVGNDFHKNDSVWSIFKNLSPWSN